MNRLELKLLSLRCRRTVKWDMVLHNLQSKSNIQLFVFISTAKLIVHLIILVIHDKSVNKSQILIYCKFVLHCNPNLCICKDGIIYYDDGFKVTICLFFLIEYFGLYRPIPNM